MRPRISAGLRAACGCPGLVHQAEPGQVLSHPATRKQMQQPGALPAAPLLQGLCRRRTGRAICLYARQAQTRFGKSNRENPTGQIQMDTRL
jgi:hypothetical protein